jgi:hypothetical protein
MPDINPQGGESYPDPRRATRMSAHGREIKMLRPICQTCEDQFGGTKFVPKGWWNGCIHDPYIGYSEQAVVEPIYNEDEDGRKILTGQRTVMVPKAKPNWVSISQDAGINSGKGPDWALRKGYIFPQQLKSPLFPEGIKRRCNFRECFSEDVKHYTGVGWFCSDQEAALVMASDQEETMITAPFGRKAEKAQAKQMQSLITEVRALA